LPKRDIGILEAGFQKNQIDTIFLDLLPFFC